MQSFRALQGSKFQYAAELEGGEEVGSFPQTEAFSFSMGDTGQVGVDLSNFSPKSRSGGGGARLDLRKNKVIWEMIRWSGQKYLVDSRHSDPQINAQNLTDNSWK